VSAAPRAVRQLRVLRDGELAGMLERTARGATFTYDPEFLDRHPRDRMGIAIHLPPTASSYESRGVNLHPFFANLLPEGARLAALLAAARSAKDDLLSLAAMVGADTIGDVSLETEDHSHGPAEPVLDVAHASAVSFRALFEESTAYGRPRREQMTVPGVQEKISAAMISFPVRARKKLSVPGILKLEPPTHPRLVANEHFFMRAARDAGIETAPCAVIVDRDGAPGLLVERFDRVVEGDGIRRVHQEDGCQLLDRYPADKYAVSIDDLAASLRVCATPILEVAKLIRLVAFSYVIANGDLHAKNVSVVRAPGAGRLVLSPAYDLLTSLPYGDAKMALPLAGRDANLRRKHFVELGGRHGVRERAVESILDQVCDGAAAWIGRVGEIGLPARKTAHLVRTIASRRDELR
jgi:serine/threonine-protein kinase HipA